MSIDPSLWGNIPFGNRTAWTDFVGQHWLWHRSLAEFVRRGTGTSYRVLPIGDGGGTRWQQAVQETYVNASFALGVAPPNDLASYELSRPEDFASWTFLLAQQASRLREAAGFN